MSNVSISTSNLTIGYPGRIVQHSLSLDLREGEMVCMLGPNGCGKSTLLRTLAGLQPALSGTVRLRDTDLALLAANERAKLLALVLTERLSLENTSVYDVVALGRHPYTSFLGTLTDDDHHIIRSALQDVAFLPTRDDMECATHLSTFNSLSDGEKQRVLIAKALAQQTPVILLDEPTAHLDLPNRIRMLQLLRRLAHEQGKTILISTHELDIAIQLSDRILLLSANGAALDTADNLCAQDAFTHAFGMDIFHPLNNTL